MKAIEKTKSSAARRVRGRQANPLVRQAAIEALEGRTLFNAVYHPVNSSAFTQDWSNTALISANNDWSGVPSIIGYTGIGTTSGQVIDSGTILTQTATNVSVIANLTDTNNNTGAVKEFQLTNPTIGGAGSNTSGTGGSPYIQLHMNTTGVNSVDVSYNVRDLEASSDDAIQKVALHYRIGTTGNWTNVPQAYIADATTGPGLATLVTPVSVTLPADAGNQANLQLRIMIGNASGNDENVGIDDIVVKATPVVQPPGSFNLPANGVRVNEGAGTATITVARSGGTGGAVTVDYSLAGITATAGSDFTATGGTVSFADGQDSADITVPLNNDTTDELAERFSVTLSNPTGGAAIGPNSSTTVTIVDNDAQPLSAGPLLQDWTDIDQITANDNYDGVLNIVGYATDAARDAGTPDVNANVTTAPNTFNTGGVTEFHLTNPTIALIGSSTAAQPQLVLDVDTTGTPAAELSFTARDLEDGPDNAAQSISVSYRIGDSGDFIEILNVADVTSGDATQDTPLSVLLPAEALGQSLVQIRIATLDASGNDEAVGIDDIRVGTPLATPGSLGFPSATPVRFDEGSGTAIVTVTRNGGSSGSVTIDYATADLTATAGVDYTAVTGTLTFADGVTSQDIVIPISEDLADELGEQFTIALSNPTGGATLGSVLTATVTIADNDGHLLSGGSFTQDWSDTDLITTNDNWNNVPNIVGYANNDDRDAGIVDVLANQSNPNISNGGIAEFSGIADPTVGFQGSNAASLPQLIIDLNTTGLTAANVAFNARDLDSTADDAAQPVSVAYRIGNTGDFIEFGLIEDATTPNLAELVTAFTAALPSEALGQSLVQVRIATTNVASNDEFVGIDDIVISTPTVGLPVWLAAGSQATWDSGSHVLTVTGAATIIADPGSDLPVVNADGSAAVLSIAPTSGTKVSLGGISLTNGASATFAANGNQVLVIENPTFTIDAASKLDLNDNDMILRGGASLASVTSLIASARTEAFDWSGNGLTSGAAAGGAFAGTTGLSAILNDVDGSGNPYYSEFDGITDLTGQDVIVKFTWYGDADLSGLVDDFDFALIDAGFSGAGTGSFFGDFDGNGVVDDFDFALVDLGYGSGGNTTQL